MLITDLSPLEKLDKFIVKFSKKNNTYQYKSLKKLLLILILK